MKTYIFFVLSILFLFFACPTAYPQENAGADFIDRALVVYPVSPEAASLGKYGDLPVNLATGRINYTVPLYTIKVGDFEWPIYLSYNSSGLKTEEDPGSVGLGWDLMAGGRISREVRGNPDELDKSTFFSDYIIPYLRGDYDGDDETIFKIYDRLTNSNITDGEPDKYFINAGTLQGSYVINHNDDTVFEVHRNYKVSGNIITDERGIEYHFEEEETGLNEVEINGDSFSRELVTSRLLTKIAFPNKKGVILFEYYPLDFLNAYNKTTRTDLEITGATSERTYSTNESTTYNRLLKKITFPNGNIEFITNQYQSNESTVNTLEQIIISINEANPMGYVFTYNHHDKFKKVLEKIQKTGNNQKMDFYSFTYYDDHLLNDDFHYSAQDLWGFYNGSPSTNLLDANRIISFEKTRIGALKRITYPTKGFTEIDYELNQILTNETNPAALCSFSPNNTKSLNIKIPSGAGQTIDTIIDVGESQIVSVHMLARVSPNNPNRMGLAEINLSATSLGSACGYWPMNLSVNIDEGDLFSIENQSTESIDGEFSQNEHALGFAKDGEIHIKGEYDVGFNVTARIAVTIQYEENETNSYNKNIGGLRVKSTTSVDSLGVETQKNYLYILANEDSSGVLLGSPVFSYSTEVVANLSQDIRSGTLNYSFAKSLQPFSSYNSAPVLYERVETILNNLQNGKIINTYSKAFSISNGFPFPPVVTNDWKKGKLLKQETFNSTGEPIALKENTYKTVYPYGVGGQSTRLSEGLVVRRNKWVYVSNGLVEGNPDHYVQSQYKIYPKIMVLDKTMRTHFNEEGQSLLTTTLYNFDNPRVQPKYLVSDLSDGTKQLVHYTYPYNLSNHPLTAQNRIAEPVEERIYKKVSPSDSLLLSTQKTLYKEENGLVVPYKIQRAKGDDDLEDRHVFDRYDHYGNVLEEHRAADTARTVTLWGYNGQYPIARIENATYAAVQTALGLSGDAEPNESHLPALDALRSTQTDWQITTYRHIPLVGVSSITQPNGMVTYYQYDDFNRLKEVKDKDQKLLQTYQYHYKGSSIPQETSSQSDDEDDPSAGEETEDDYLPNPNNPYLLSNMQKAFNALYTKNAANKKTYRGKTIAKSSEITATHKMYRFIPKDDAELALVEQDTTLFLYEYPIDREYTEEELLVFERINEEAINHSYFYFSAPLNKKLTAGVNFEPLIDLYIPDDFDDPNAYASKNNLDETFIEDLVNTSMEITGNLDDVLPSSEAARKSRWRPSGTIKVYDNVVNKYIPIEGVRVRARKWLKSSYGITNDQGHFSGNRKFRRKANYMIKWKRLHFVVRNGDFFQATKNGPKIRAPWNLNINGGKSLRFAHIFRAAYNYIYQNPFDTKNPPKNPGLSGRIKISYNHKSGGAGFAGWRTFVPGGIAPAIRIFKSSSGEEFSTQKIYAITAHELAHTAHWKLIVDAPGSNRWRDYQNADENLLESWAVFMETLFTRHFVNPNYDRWPEFLYRRPQYRATGAYSDFFNEIFETTNYSILQMEQALVKANSLESWKNNLKDLYNGDEAKLEAIYATYYTKD